MVLDAGVDFTFHTNLIDVESSNGKITAAGDRTPVGFRAYRYRKVVRGIGDISMLEVRYAAPAPEGIVRFNGCCMAAAA